MKKVIVLFSVAALFFSAFSCKKSGAEIPDRYKAVEELAIKESAAVDFDAAGGNHYLTVVGNDKTVSVKSDAEWVNVTVSGQSVTLSCDENFTLLTRYARVTISSSGKSCSVQVKQTGVSSEYFWEESYAFSAAGGQLALKFIPTTLTIKMKLEGSEWISASIVDNIFYVTVAKNDTNQERSGKVTWQVADEVREFVIIQAKGNGGGTDPNPPAGDVLFSEDFEDIDRLQDWVLLDVDLDEHAWNYSDYLASHSGLGMVYSMSYDGETQKPLTPDNWLITPAIGLATDNYVSFWVAGQDPDWAEEHYGVYVSETMPETSLDVFEELFAATNPVASPYESEVLSFVDDKGESTDITWQRIAVKIPDTYDNKTVYIAFRHFDCSDMFMLNLDDVMVTKGQPEKTVVSTSSVNSVKYFPVPFVYKKK